MGTHVIKMPDIGEGIAQVELVEWFVKVGDSVTEDQVVADVMTDKATVEIPSPVSGTVISLGGAPGDVLAVGSDLIRIAVTGEAESQAVEERHTDTPSDTLPAQASGVGGEADTLRGRALCAEEPAGAAQDCEADTVAPASIANNGTPPTEVTAPTAAQTAPAPIAVRSDQARQPEPAAAAALGTDQAQAEHPGKGNDQGNGRALAAPAVRKRAADLGIDLHSLNGSGPDGQILHADLDTRLQAPGVTRPGATSARGSSSEQQIPVIGLRRKIAERMQDAKRRVAHFSYVEEIDVTAVEALRVELNQRWGDQRGRLTLLPLLVRALVVAVREFPQINARYDDEAQLITRHGAVHLGIATQSDNGLMVPVLRHAEAADLWTNAKEIQRLADAARRGKAIREELSGSTLTLSSLGALGGIVSTPVVNTPEVAIVGVNRIVERPVVMDGQIVIRKMMNLSSSFDHRVVDGMDAAKFIQAVKRLLEQPSLLFID
jgi:2-oxoisovalerate dehydrogenase E2 component (dihydrolipoyl transacylase)